MKQYLFAVTLIAGSIPANAQTKQGTITYQRKADMHRRMEDEQMKAMIPQFRTDKYILLFKDNISVYKSIAEEEAPDPFENSGGNRIQIKIGGPGENAVKYKNFNNQKYFEQTELGDKDYIIDDTIKDQPWKLSDETKTVLNHVCKKATVKTERGSDVTAWYAEDIQTPAGPDNFSGLPGAILLLDINNAEIVFTAVDIKTTADDKDLKEPAKGKHITRADFEKKMDELFGPPTADGKRIITREN